MVWWFVAAGGGAALLICGAGVFLLAHGLPLAPGSREYEPVSAMERVALTKSRRNIFPDDVRSNLPAHKNTMVAWAGVIREHTTATEAGRLVIRFETEHRYFDWIDDFSVRPERHLISPRGEGRFRAAWTMPPGSEATIASNVHDGDLLIAYGTPDEIRDGVIGFFPTAYVRVIPARLVTDRIIDYGRLPP